MIDVSADFLSAIKDNTKRKVVLMIVNLWSLWFTGEDFVEGGITIDDYFCTDEDLSYGNTPSARCSFSIFADGVRDGVKAFLSSETGNPLSPSFGVEVAKESFTFGSNVLSHIEFIPDDGESTNTVVVEGRTDGLYFNNTKIDNGVYKTLLFRGNVDVVCIGDNDTLYFTCSDSAVDYIGQFDADDFMIRKFATNGKASWAVQYDPLRGQDASFNWYTWSDGEKVTYEMVNGGFFYSDISNIRKAYIGNVLSFSDIPDAMFMLDSPMYNAVPESALADYLDTPQTTTPPTVSYPMKLNELANISAHFAYPALGYGASAEMTARFNAISYSSNPLHSYSFSYRQLYGWMCEAARANCICTKNNWTDIEPRWLNSDDTEVLTGSDISIDGFSVAWYKTLPIQRVVLEHDGGSYEEFVLDPDAYAPNTYVISNPLIKSMTLAEAQTFADGIPTYYPITFTVISANPAVEVGDMVKVVGIGIGDDPDFTIPLMHRRMVFNGAGFTAEYEATGGYQRESTGSYDLQNNVTRNANDIADINSQLPDFLTAATGVTSVNGSHGDVTVSDTKVTQTAGSATSNWRSVVLSYANSSSEGFTPSSYTNSVYVYSPFKAQPSTGTLSATTFKGNLTGDVTGTASGNLTAATGVTSVNGSHGDVTVSDTKVTQTYASYSSYSNWRPLVIGNSNGSSESFTPSTVTNSTYTFSNLKVQPSTGTIKATTFKGDLTGTASGNLACCAGSASASGSVAFNLSNGFRGVLVVQGATSGTNGMYMVWVSGSGAITSYDIRVASSVTFSNTTGKMTITAPSSTGVQVMWYITNGTASVA